MEKKFRLLRKPFFIRDKEPDEVEECHWISLDPEEEVKVLKNSIRGQGESFRIDFRSGGKSIKGMPIKAEEFYRHRKNSRVRVIHKVFYRKEKNADWIVVCSSGTLFDELITAEFEFEGRLFCGLPGWLKDNLMEEVEPSAFSDIELAAYGPNQASGQDN